MSDTCGTDILHSVAVATDALWYDRTPDRKRSGYEHIVPTGAITVETQKQPVQHFSHALARIAPNQIPPPLAPTRSLALMRLFAEPEGKVFLLYGESTVFRLALLMAARALVRGSRIAVIDGCNRFDVHAITRYARERRLDPNAMLRRIFVSRGFTAYQMEAAVTNKLPAFCKRVGSQTALIFGLLDTFYDKQAPIREVRQMLARILQSLHAMKAAGISILLASNDWKVEPAERNQLLHTLKAGMDSVYYLALNAKHQPQLFLEDCRGVSNHGPHRTDVHQHHRQ
jgi:hypothetical protein